MNKFRFIWLQLIISSLVTLAGILMITFIPLDLLVTHLLIMVIVMTVITILSYLIMARGIEKSNREGTFFLLSGLGLKFLLYLVFILLFWIFTKNLTKPFIITFFLLYLTFTFFMVLSLFKLLKDK